MRRLKFICFIGMTIMIMACQPGINYTYQEFPQHVICDGLDQELMHEAIYSFQDDIGQYYNQYSDYQKGSKSYYIEAYAQFVYFGFSGTAAFYDIVSPHSQAILAKLAQEKGLWQMVDGQQRLNYAHPYVICLIDHISSDDLRVLVQNLRATGSLTPELIAETMRINFQQIIADPYLAMYMALDAYYQPIRNKTPR